MRLQKLNLTMSYTSVLRLIEQMGSSYDFKVKKWQSIIEDTLEVNISDTMLHYNAYNVCIVSVLTWSFGCFLI